MGIFEDNADNELNDQFETLEKQVNSNDPGFSTLATLVGDDKKFKDVEALARGKVLSDAFIEKLIGEKRAVEAKLAEAKRIEDFMTELRSLSKNGNELSNNENIVTERNPSENTNALDPQALTEQVIKALEDRNRANTEVGNVAKVKTELTNKFGPQWKAKLEEYANTMGMSKEAVDVWARQNPDGVIRAVDQHFGVKKEADPTPPIGSYRPSPSTIVTGGKKMEKFSDFQAVRKSNPALYNSHEFQVKLHDTAVRMGDAFFT